MAALLYIEPDIVLAQTYSAALVHAGHSVHICRSAQAGIEAADEQRPDAVILELQLVAHSGLEFLYEFRSYADWRGVPVIVLSHVPQGEFDGSQELLAGHLGVRAYLYKPRTSLRRLLRAVDMLVSVHTMKA